MKQAYSILAKYYDCLMGDFNYIRYSEFLKTKLIGKEVIEFACGSGKMSLMLANLGYKVLGVDISAEMLNVAVENAKNAGKNILYICEDILKFKFNKITDNIISVCDGLNYLPQKSLKKLFLKINKFLNIGGKFIFDISSEYKLINIVGDNVFSEEFEEYTYIWSNIIKKVNIDMQLIFFEKENELYRKSSEYHTQYIHKTAEIEKLLCESGFSVLIFDGEDFGKLKKTSKRVLFECVKT